MLKIVVIWLLLFGSSIIAQIMDTDINEKIRHLKLRKDFKTEEIEKGIYKIQYPNGESVIKNTNDYELPAGNKFNYAATFNSTIIDLTTIDTLPYYQKYSYWQEVPLHNWQFDYVRVADVNKNHKIELYGENGYSPVQIYELNDFNNFEFLYEYDSGEVRDVVDVNNDGDLEVHMTDELSYREKYFSKLSDTSLAKELNFTFYIEDQLNDQTLGNLDGDFFPDLAFLGFSTLGVYIYEYNPIINNFDSLYHFKATNEYGYGGFSIGDFDMDGFADLVCGTMRGNVYIVENQGDNQYTNSWQGMVETYNAYYHTWTHDIDKNGMPEFWVMGDATFGGIPETRITIFETNGNNSYQAVGCIYLIGIFSWWADNLQTIDIDNDGTDEVAVCIDGNFLILKFNGKLNHQSFGVYYIKQASGGEVYGGSIMADLLNNGEIEILISMGINQTSTATRIYRSSPLAVMENEIFTRDLVLYQNYPNPFNPSTNIKFALNQPELVTIKIYNILGKEITTLVNKHFTSGNYDLNWEAKDGNGKLLPSGVYLINISAGDYTRTIKALLVK